MTESPTLALDNKILALFLQERHTHTQDPVSPLGSSRPCTFRSEKEELWILSFDTRLPSSGLWVSMALPSASLLS